MKFKDSDLSQIFPPEVKPVRVGEYMAWEVKDSASIFLNLIKCGKPYHPLYWDGKQWRYNKNEIACHQQNFYWRGLNRDPKLIEKERGE